MLLTGDTTKRAEKWAIIGWWWHHPRRFGYSYLQKKINKTFNKRKNRALLTLRRSQKHYEIFSNVLRKNITRKQWRFIGNNRYCMIQSWLSAWVVRDFISHSLHNVVAWFAIGDFCLPCSKEKRSYNWPFRWIYIWICSKGFDECRGFIFSPENSTIASGEVNMNLFVTVTGVSKCFKVGGRLWQSRRLWDMLPQKILKSRSTEMPFSTF